MQHPLMIAPPGLVSLSQINETTYVDDNKTISLKEKTGLEVDQSDPTWALPRGILRIVESNECPPENPTRFNRRLAWLLLRLSRARSASRRKAA
jgi:hypothetical protein